MNQHLLSQSEINHYHDEGFLIPQLTLEGSEIEELKHAVDRVLDANSGIRPEQLISVHIDRLNDEGVRGDRAFFELANHPKILDCVEQLIGPDIILLGVSTLLQTWWRRDGGADASGWELLAD